MDKIKFLVIFVLLSSAVFAQQPTLMSLQGKLINTSTGAKIISADLRVNITDSNGNLVFNHSFSNAVSNGMFDLLLGSAYYLNLSYNEDYNLSIYVGSSDTPVGGPYTFRGGQGQVGAGDIAETESYTFSNVSVTGNFSIESNMSVDSGTLFVDAENNFVGIGTSSPAEKLVVIGSVNVSGTLNVSGRITFPNLASCDTIDTDADGVLSCGTDTAGGDYAAAWTKTNYSAEYTASGFDNENFTARYDVRTDRYGIGNVTEYLGDGGNGSILRNLTIGAAIDNATINRSIILDDYQLKGDIFTIANYSAEYATSGFDNENFTARLSVENTSLWNITQGNITPSDAGKNVSVGELFVDIENERVGIGTSSPTKKLHVIGSANITGTVYAHNFSGNSNISFLNASGDEIVRFTDTGRVGIGINNPSEKLNVSGNMGISENVIASGNVTLGQKITFAFGEIIDNIVDGIIKINGNLNVSGNVTASSVTETNGVLKQNLLTNSGFGVWSNSEDLYTTAGDDVADDTVEDATDLVQNGNMGSWQGGDPDLPVGWSNQEADAGEISDGGGYINLEVDAGDEGCITNTFTTEAGKLYELTASLTRTSGVLRVYFYDGNGDFVRNVELTATDATYTDVYEETTSGSAAKIVFRSQGGAAHWHIDKVQVHEVTPGITSGTNGPDGWAKSSTNMQLYREHNGTNTKGGSFYALKVNHTSSNVRSVSWPSTNTNAEWLQRFAGRTVTFGAWVKTSNANNIRLMIESLSLDSYSDYHTGGGDWEWLEVTHTSSPSPSRFDVGVSTSVASSTDYISQPTLVFGNSIGEGNYMQPPGEVVWLETSPVGNTYDNSHSLVDATVNTETEWNGIIPKGIVSIKLYIGATADGAGDRFFIRDESGGDHYGHFTFQVAMQVWTDTETKCDANGDFYIDETGGGITNVGMSPLAVQVS